MNRSVYILDELNEISPLLAGIGRENIFTVPAGYFDTIAGTVLLSVNDNAHQSTLTDDLPVGYFDNLSSSILGKIKGTVENELSELSPVLAGIKKENLFKVPDNYFEQLPADILLQLNEEETSVFLKNARNLQPFSVPPEYFENLSAEILNKVQQQSGAKVVTMPKRRNIILKYAAAAVFSGAVLLGVYKFTNNTSIVVDEETTAANIDSVTKKGMTIAADDKKFEATLGNLDEETITKYLEKNTSETDIALLTSGIEEGTLPEQDEYLMDEKTLDNFIEEISLKN